MHVSRLDSAGAVGLNIAAGGVPGDAGSFNLKPISKASIADNTATTVFTLTIPNVTTSVAIDVLWTATFDGGATINASTRAGRLLIVATRRVNVAAVAAIIPIETSATNPVTNVNQLVMSQIATLASENTFTTSWALGSVTGGATASETVAVQVTNIANTGTQSTTVYALCTIINTGASGATIA